MEKAQRVGKLSRRRRGDLVRDVRETSGPACASTPEISYLPNSLWIVSKCGSRELAV
jgi:hypothetical protein